MGSLPEVPCAFFTLVNNGNDVLAAKTLIRSLRYFGGAYGNALLYVFVREDIPAYSSLQETNVKLITLALGEPLRSYPFAYKVYAAAKAAELGSAFSNKIIWLDPSAVVVKPPVLFDLSSNLAAVALRPVHVRNIGLRFDQPIDDFWSRIYSEVNFNYNTLFQITSYVDMQPIRPYFNCGAYAIDTENGILQLWWKYFQQLVADASFQEGTCKDAQHRLFLHQSIFSALVCTLIPYEHICILPPEYGYPLHFHDQLCLNNRHVHIDDVVCILGYYEDIATNDKKRIFKNSSRSLREWLLKNVCCDP